MRITRVLAAAGIAAVLSLAPAQGALAAPTVSATVSGSTVTITAKGCTTGASAAYLRAGGGQESASPAKNMTGGAGTWTTSFSGLPPGSYIASVVCSEATSPDYGTANFTIGPRGGAKGGDGGAPYSTMAVLVGIALLGIAAGGFVLRRRRTAAAG